MVGFFKPNEKYYGKKDLSYNKKSKAKCFSHIFKFIINKCLDTEN